MEQKDYIKYDALELAGLIKRGEVSPGEVLSCALSVIEQINPSVRAIIETHPPVPSNAGADQVFYGVPFLLKDVGSSFPGLKREYGSQLAEGVTAVSTGNLAKRFLRAGLQIFGRTKSPEMAFNITTESKLYGPVHNPWDLSRSAGGSSGGAAAAVASRMVPMAEANDGGGSIRIPASCNGVVGLKPSRGRISCAPDAWEFLNGLSGALVTSRSVRDTAAMLDVLQGPEPGDPYPVAKPEMPYLETLQRRPPSLKIALVTEAWTTNIPVHNDCTDAATDVARLCKNLGHHVEPQKLDIGVGWETFTEANARIWCINIARWIDGLSKQTGRPATLDTLEATTLACYHYGKTQSAENVLDSFDIFNRVSRTIGEFHRQYDLILSPTLPNPPHLLGAFDANRSGMTGLDWSHFILSGSPFTPVFNVTGQPAISLPLAWNGDGLPIGIQFVADMGREDLLLGLAAQLEECRPWQNRMPSIPGTTFV